MSEEKKSNDKDQNKSKRNLMDLFLTREKPDEDYIPDIKDQWDKMDTGQRVKFILGAVLGLLIVLGGIILIIFLISALQT